MHPLCLLLDIVPELLVESRALHGTGSTAAGLSMDCGFARRGDRRAARFSGRSVSPLSLPHDPELLADLPEGTEPGKGNHRNPQEDGHAPVLTGRSRCDER